MIYLLIGHDLLKKDAKIAEIKNKLFKDPSVLSFDYESLHAHKLDHDDLTKSLLTLPHLAPQRLIVLRQCERLHERNRATILEFLSQRSKTTVLVLDFDELDVKSALFGRLKPLTETTFFGSKKTLNVFDMTRAISSSNAAEALKILYELLGNNTHPLQIMGGLVWYWGKERERLSTQSFHKGLSVLEEADLNIKRSRLKPEYAVEKVVVELAMLRGGLNEG